MGQAVAEVLAGNGNHQPQVRQHQAPRSVHIVVFLELAGVFLFLFLGQQRKTVDGRNVGVEVAQRRHQRPGVGGCQSGCSGSR